MFLSWFNWWYMTRPRDSRFAKRTWTAGIEGQVAPNGTHDCLDALIVGGGPAGLGAALSLGRLMRHVLVLDDDAPRNGPSSHVYNFPGQDGIHPAAWRDQALRDLRRYDTVHVGEDRVATAQREGSSFRARMASGGTVRARKLVLAYGMADRLPDIPGLREAWGTSVLHCPFCHGYEVRGQQLGLFGNPAMFGHVAPIVAGLARDLVLFTNGRSLTSDQRGELSGFEVIEGRVVAVAQQDGQVERVLLEGDRAIGRDALFFAADFPLSFQSDLSDQLGCVRGNVGLIQVDAKGQTSVPGVYAAGDVAAFSSVLLSAASGSNVGAALCFELAHEDHHAAAETGSEAT